MTIGPPSPVGSDEAYPTYVAIKGVVFDVSKNPTYKNGAYSGNHHHQYYIQPASSVDSNPGALLVSVAFLPDLT